MRTEERLRNALQREAEKHRVNPILPPKTLARATVRRSVMFFGATVFVASAVVGGVGVVEFLDKSPSSTAPASDPSNDENSSDNRSEGGAPLLLIVEQGWEISYTDMYGAKEGEMTFSDGAREMELMWIPARLYESRVRDRQADAEESWNETILGHEAVLIQYEGTTDFTALWLDGDLAMELRGEFATVDDYRVVAETLQYVDEESWLAAMPDTVIEPAERPKVVEEMLADIPVHQDVDVQTLKSSPAVQDRYQLGAQVSGAVACEWIEQWIDANGRGGSAQEAADAMGTSRDWAILVEMKDQGGWSQVVWEYADRMAENDRSLARESTVEDEPSEDGVMVVGTYSSSLGC